MNEGWDYKPLTNEGGGAAGDRRTRSEVSNESLVRVWGFRRERFGLLGGGFDGLDRLFFDNCIERKRNVGGGCSRLD